MFSSILNDPPLIIITFRFILLNTGRNSFMVTSSNGSIFCVTGLLLSPVHSPHKSQWRRVLMFSLIYAWTDSRANNGHVHYDVIVMLSPNHLQCVPCILTIKFVLLSISGSFTTAIRNWVWLYCENHKKSQYCSQHWVRSLRLRSYMHVNIEVTPNQLQAGKVRKTQ